MRGIISPRTLTKQNSNNQNHNGDSDEQQLNNQDHSIAEKIPELKSLLFHRNIVFTVKISQQYRRQQICFVNGSFKLVKGNFHKGSTNNHQFSKMMNDCREPD